MIPDIIYQYIYIHGCETKCKECKAPIHTLNPQADPYPNFDATPCVCACVSVCMCIRVIFNYIYVYIRNM